MQFHNLQDYDGSFLHCAIVESLEYSESKY